MRTVEFKLSLNQSQQAQVDNWLNVQRWTWNRGLHLLEEFASFMAWDQGAKAWPAFLTKSGKIGHQKGYNIAIATVSAF